MATVVQESAADFDFRGQNTQYGTHGIHTYVASMIPQLARRLIDKHVPEGGTVFDPFCGGGSVLVEAVGSERGVIGRDVNPLAVLISKAKATRVSQSEAETALGQIMAAYRLPDTAPLVEQNLAYWFKPKHLGELYGLRLAIDRITSADPIAALFNTVFLSHCA